MALRPCRGASPAPGLSRGRHATRTSPLRRAGAPTRARGPGRARAGWGRRPGAAGRPPAPGPDATEAVAPAGGASPAADAPARLDRRVGSAVPPVGSGRPRPHAPLGGLSPGAGAPRPADRTRARHRGPRAGDAGRGRRLSGRQPPPPLSGVGRLAPAQDAPRPPASPGRTPDAVRERVAGRPRPRARVPRAVPHGLRAAAVSRLPRAAGHAPPGRLDLPRGNGARAPTAPRSPAEGRRVQTSLWTRAAASSALVQCQPRPLRRAPGLGGREAAGGPGGGQAAGHAAFAGAPAREGGASPGRRCGGRRWAGPVGARQEPAPQGGPALPHRPPRCSDTATLCQASCGLTSALVPALPSSFHTLGGQKASCPTPCRAGG
jgi:translation initiation factor IF-2